MSKKRIYLLFAMSGIFSILYFFFATLESHGLIVQLLAGSTILLAMISVAFFFVFKKEKTEKELLLNFIEHNIMGIDPLKFAIDNMAHKAQQVFNEEESARKAHRNINDRTQTSETLKYRANKSKTAAVDFWKMYTYFKSFSLEGLLLDTIDEHAARFEKTIIKMREERDA